MTRAARFARRLPATRSPDRHRDSVRARLHGAGAIAAFDVRSGRDEGGARYHDGVGPSRRAHLRFHGQAGTILPRWSHADQP